MISLNKSKYLYVICLSSVLLLTFLALLPVPKVYANPAYEDFTTYTELDPGTRINKTANHIDFISRKDEDAWLVKYKGLNYFASVFEHFLDVRLIEASTSGDFACVWLISNNKEDIQYLRDYSLSYYAIYLYNATYQLRMVLEEKNDGSPHHNDYGAISLNTWYYLRIIKKTTNLQCKIYSTSALRDIGGSPDIDTLSLTITDNSFQYIYGCNTLNSGTALQAEVDIENFELRDRIIEYDSTNNIITSLGATETNPISFYEVWLANDIGEWEVINNTCNTQFKFHCRINIGDGSITTWFEDVKVQVVFKDGIITQNDVNLIWIRDNAHFTLGKLDSATHKLTSQGVSMIDLETTYRTRPITCSGSGETNLYSFSIITSTGTTRLYLRNGKCYNSMFMGVGYGISVFPTNMDIYNSFIEGGYEGWANPSNCILDTIRVGKSFYGSRLVGVSGVILKNLIGRLNNYDLVLDSRYTNYILNADLDEWNILWYLTSTAKSYRQYEFDLSIFFENGTEIENANVTIKNDYLGTSTSWLTFANGSIPMQIYSMGHYNQTGGNTIYNYNPYNITISYPGYETYRGMINITDKLSLEICLCPVKASYGLGLGSGFILALILSLALLVSIVAIQRKRS